MEPIAETERYSLALYFLAYNWERTDMFLNVKAAIGYKVLASDGEVGKLVDILFSDKTSKVRYLVVDTGSWLSSRKVLLAPDAVGSPSVSDRIFETDLTKEQVENSPPAESDKPVSRRYEESLHHHYGWTPYWLDPMGAAPTADHWGVIAQVAENQNKEATADAAEIESTDLRSGNEVLGYGVEARDGDIGQVSDLLVPEENWIIRYAVVDTGNWLPGKKVLIATDWLQSVDWHGKKITTQLSQKQIETSTPYDPSITFDKAYQEELYRHVNMTAPWF